MALPRASSMFAVGGRCPDAGSNTGRTVDIGATAAVLALAMVSHGTGRVLYVAEEVIGNQLRWEVLT